MPAAASNNLIWAFAWRLMVVVFVLGCLSVVYRELPGNGDVIAACLGGWVADAIGDVRAHSH